MKCVALTLLLSLCASVNAGAAGGHPIEKVIKLIEDLKSKAIAEGKDEEVAYTKFQYWCSTSIAELKDAIADEKEKIDELEDKIAGLTKDKETLETEIGELEDQLGELDASAKKAKDARAAEAKLYDKANADLESTIKAVDECIKALEGAEGKTEAMLAQRHVKMVLALVGLKVTDQQRSVLDAFAKQRPDQLAAGDLAKHTDKYDFKSENVIELLKQLKLKFEDDKLAGTKAETNSLNNYEMAKEARDNAIKAAKKAKKEKETELAATKRSIADANKELKSTQSDLKADSESLKDTQDTCSTRASEWAERSNTRSKEIEAMDQAMKILSKSTGVRTEAPGNPIPPASPVKFLQISETPSDSPQMKAVALIRATATEMHSRALERLAQEVAAHLSGPVRQGPFDAVNNMIEKMIFRLMDEQKKEDEHKHWCDQEIKKTETMIEDKNTKIDDLKAEIKVQTAEVAKLTDEIADAEKMISDIVSFMKEATEIRQTGKKENALAIKDAKDAQKSLTNAISVLKDFYKSSGEIPKEPWEFIQKPVNLGKEPATWDAGYTGVADPDKQPGGIVSVLEAVQDDFSKMEADTKSQEAQDQKEYEESMKANEIEKSGREQEVSMKTQEKARRNDKIAQLNSQKKNVEAELEKTEQYSEDLKPACVDTDKGASYDDRKAARAKEIKALQKAQVILEEAFKEKAKFLQIKKHSQ